MYPQFPRSSLFLPSIQCTRVVGWPRRPSPDPPSPRRPKSVGAPKWRCRAPPCHQHRSTDPAAMAAGFRPEVLWNAGIYTTTGVSFIEKIYEKIMINWSTGRFVMTNPSMHPCDPSINLLLHPAVLMIQLRRGFLNWVVGVGIYHNIPVTIQWTFTLRVYDP
jgi:hypothetical protein